MEMAAQLERDRVDELLDLLSEGLQAAGLDGLEFVGCLRLAVRSGLRATSCRERFPFLQESAIALRMKLCEDGSPVGSYDMTDATEQPETTDAPRPFSQEASRRLARDLADKVRRGFTVEAIGLLCQASLARAFNEGLEVVGGSTTEDRDPIVTTGDVMVADLRRRMGGVVAPRHARQFDRTVAGWLWDNAARAVPAQADAILEGLGALASDSRAKQVARLTLWLAIATQHGALSELQTMLMEVQCRTRDGTLEGLAGWLDAKLSMLAKVEAGT